MSKQISFTKIENELLHKFRQKMGLAESTEDVKKFYAYTTLELLNRVFENAINFNYGDIALTPGKSPYYQLNSSLSAKNDFSSVWNNSDLPNVIARFTETAINHHNHFDNNPDKTK